MLFRSARRDEVYVQSFGDIGPGEARLIAVTALPTGPVIGHGGVAPKYPIAEAIARLAAARVHSAQPRPAPFYIRGADAAPSSDPPPVILP